MIAVEPGAVFSAMSCAMACAAGSTSSTGRARETIFISASLKDKGIQFLKGEGTIGVRKNVPSADSPTPAPASSTGRYQVTVSGRTFDVQLDGDAAVVSGKRYPFSVSAGEAAEGPAAPAPEAGTQVCSELPGKVLAVDVSTGDQVTEGQRVLLLEALKMEIEVKAPRAGAITTVAVESGQQIRTGDLLLSIG